MSYLSSDPIDPAALIDTFTRAADDAGAIVSFTGVVRGEGGVRQLWLDHHPALTEHSIAAIDSGTRARFAVENLLIVHRVGAVAPGEPIVVVVAAARHRRAAFEAVDHAMDRLKVDAMLWKREHGPDGVRWIEARPQDHGDRERWEDQA